MGFVQAMRICGVQEKGEVRPGVVENGLKGGGQGSAAGWGTVCEDLRQKRWK